MSDPGTPRIHLSGAILLAVFGAGFALAVAILLFSSGRAGAAELPGLPAQLTQTLAPVTQTLAPVTQTLAPVTQTLAPVTQTLAPVTQTLAPVTQAVGGVLAPLSGVLPGSASGLSATLGMPGQVVGSTSNQRLSTGTATFASLGGPTGPMGSRSALSVPALPVSSLPTNANAVLGGVMIQGPLATAIEPRSATSDSGSLGVVHGTGSADVLPKFSLIGLGSISGLKAVSPRPSPHRPLLPGLPLGAMGSPSGSGAHGSALDSLPPAALVLALLVAAGMGLEGRRRPKLRFDLRFSPPG